MDYEREILNDVIIIKLKPVILDYIRSFKIYKNKEDDKPISTNTATTDMRDFIGNVSAIDEGIGMAGATGKNLIVEGIYRGKQRNNLIVKNFCKSPIKIAERIMVTEHLNIHGEMELVGTKKRILNYGDLNFMNFGWGNKKRFRYLRIDIYTGECMEIEGVAVSGI